MGKLFNKEKDYIVSIISKNTIQKVNVKAVNKKEAITLITDILLKCPIFNFKSVKDFKLKCIRDYKGGI